LRPGASVLTKMKSRFIVVLSSVLLLASLTAQSQVSLADGAVVNGLPLLSTYDQVLTKFGKPARETPGICVDIKSKQLEYDGLKVWMWVPRNDREFKVGGFEISKPGWSASGIEVGASEAAIKKRFGPRFEEAVDAKGKKTIFYLIKSKDPIGNTGFFIKDGKVAQMGTRYLVFCISK
jgi:hypothetical protein